MSLIQEALRRQQEESGDGRPLDPKRSIITPVAAESTPPPKDRKPAVPAAKPPPAPPAKSLGLAKNDKPPEAPPVPRILMDEKNARPLSSLLGILLVLLLLAGGGIWLIYFAFDHFVSSGASSDSARVEQTRQAETPPVAPLKPTVAEQPVPDQTVTVKPTVPETPAVPPATPIETVATPPVPPVAPPAHQTDVTPEVKEPVQWPTLSLSGVIGHGNSGSVIINGEIVAVNESISGVKVCAIEKQGAKLEYKGETQYIKVGNATR